MKIRLGVIFGLCFFVIFGFAQNLGKDYNVINKNQLVSDIAYENPYVSPLGNYLARIHLWVEGKYDTIYSEMIDAKVRQSSQLPYSKKSAERLLSSEIEQIITYKDSIGLVFRKDMNDPEYYAVGFSQWENGKWLGIGEDICYAKNMNDATQYIENKSVRALYRLRQYYRQKIVSTDTLVFINYLKQYGKNPEKYFLEKITYYPLVIYGEIHRRQLSWDLLTKVIHNPCFVQQCGTIFMELPSYNQSLFDELLQSNSLDTSLIFNALRSEQQFGWQDKGEFEFIKEIWKINQQANRKIRIIPVDFQIHWDSLQTRSDCELFIKNKMRDRDSTMAEIINYHLINRPDERNCLFIVGQDHARKSSPNLPVSAATLLKELLKDNLQMQIFSIASHGMIGDNTHWLGKVRYGLFDAVFEKWGNKPVAFDLKNSLFGKEPYDASQSVRFEYGAGNYEDFYDGYIFLCPLEEEPYDYELKDLYTSIFVEELKRRAYLINSKDAYYGIPIDSITVERIHRRMDSNLQKSNNKKYWIFYNN